MATQKSATAWRNRIVGHGMEAPDQLAANPRNWRIHPKAQQDALAGALEEIGWVGEVLVNQRTGYVVDGHLRVALALRHGELEVPVTYVDLTEEEEALVIATLDPIGAMAAADKEKLGELLESIRTDSDAMRGMLMKLRETVVDIPIIDNSWMPDDRHERQQLSQSSMIVAIGRISAVIDRTLVEDLMLKISQHFGDNETVAIKSFCEWANECISNTSS